MKVLYIIDSLKAYGAEKSLALLACSFEKIEPVFISLNTNIELLPVLESKGIKVYSGIESKNPSIQKTLNRIIEIVKKENPSIIHSTLYRSDAISRKLKKKLPEILLVGSLVSNSYSKSRYQTLSFFSKLKLFSTQIKDRFTVKYVDNFISNSQAIVDSNRNALGLPMHKVEVIHRGRELPMIFSDPKSSKAKYSDKKVFITVGRLCKNKGQLDLVRVFKRLNLEKLNIILLIIGDGPDHQKLKKEIIDAKLQDYIHLLGYKEDVQPYYEIADYFIFPSYYEGLPGALIEAIFAKLPCIVSNIAENKECLSPDGGIYFEPGNLDSIEAAIQNSLQLNNWESKVAENYLYASSHFSLISAAKKYENFYYKIIDQKH